MGDTAHSNQRRDRTACKALGRGQRSRQGQLDHQIDPGAYSHRRPAVFVHDGEVAALHEIARHNRDNCRLIPDLTPCFGAVIGMTVVERVVFGHDAANFHKSPPKKSAIDVVHLRGVVYNNTI